jgi:hypothetical protein
MLSMENFFKWMSKPIPNDEVVVWFSVHNMIPERIELYGDIFKSLHQIILETYLGEESSETKISMSDDDKTNHFEWCWKTLLDNFAKENIRIKHGGKHKDYFQEFFKDTFYNQLDTKIRSTIPQFLGEIFNMTKPFTKSDLDIMTELYKCLEKNIED